MSLPQPLQGNQDNAAAAVGAAAAGSQLPGAGDPLLTAQAVNPFDIQAIIESLGSPVDAIPGASVRLAALRQFYLGQDPYAASHDPRNALSTTNSLFGFAAGSAPAPEAARPLIGGTGVAASELVELQTATPGRGLSRSAFQLAHGAAPQGRRLSPNAFLALRTQPVNAPYVGHASGALSGYVDALHAGTVNALYAQLTPATARRPGESLESFTARVDPFGILARDTWANRRSPWVQRVSSLCVEHNRAAQMHRMHPVALAKALLTSPNVPVEHARFLRGVEHYFARNPNAPRLPHGDDPAEHNFDDLVAYMRDTHRAANERMHPLL